MQNSKLVKMLVVLILALPIMIPTAAAFDLDPGGGGGVIKNELLGWKTCEWSVSGLGTGRLSIWVDDMYLTYCRSGDGYLFTGYKVKIAYSWSGAITLDNAQFTLRWGSASSSDYIGDAWYIGDGDFPSNGVAKTYTGTLNKYYSTWTTPQFVIFAEGKRIDSTTIVGSMTLTFKITPSYLTPWSLSSFSNVGATWTSQYWDSFLVY